MKPENEMNNEVRQLLNSLEEHGQNARRQKELSDLIDRLAEEEKTVEMPRKHRKLAPLWWAMGAAAACLLLWLLANPNPKQVPETNEQIFVEQTEAADSIKTEENSILEERVIKEELIAEETPVVPQKPQFKKEKPKAETFEEGVEQPVFAENTSTETADTMNVESNTISTVNEEPIIVQSPKRRVIQSLNLVCYDCQKEPGHNTKPNLENKTLFGQPQDPNMKNGALAFEIKLD